MTNPFLHNQSNFQNLINHWLMNDFLVVHNLLSHIEMNNKVQIIKSSNEIPILYFKYVLNNNNNSSHSLIGIAFVW